MITLDAVSFLPAGADRPILHDVSLTIGRGERIGIVGPSGSGKSTLGYHLCGVHRLALAGVTTGALTLDGRDALAGGQPGFAGLVGQNPEAQLFCRTVLDEVLLGPRMRGEAEAVCQDKAGALLARHGLGAKAENKVTSLSLGQKQLTAILSMLAIEPKVLLLDEPTSYLDTATADRLFAHLDDLSRSRGWIVCVIEHDRTRLAGFADRFLTMAEGRLVADGPLGPPPAPFTRPLGPAPSTRFAVGSAGEPLLRFDAVSFGYAKGACNVTGIDFAVGPGECVALVGPNGSGKSTVLRLAKGLAKPGSGQVRLGRGLGQFADVGLMLQNPEEQIFAHAVAAECGYWLVNQGVVATEREERVQCVLAALGLGGKLNRAPFSLSFGEKRRLCLASILVGAPSILCLDEPTTGLDDANMAAMADMIRRETAAGKAVLVASHEEAFVNMVATRVVRLEAGRMVGDHPMGEGTA